MVGVGVGIGVVTMITGVGVGGIGVGVVVITTGVGVGIGVGVAVGVGVGVGEGVGVVVGSGVGVGVGPGHDVVLVPGRPAPQPFCANTVHLYVLPGCAGKIVCVVVVNVSITIDPEAVSVTVARYWTAPEVELHVHLACVT